MWAGLLRRRAAQKEDPLHFGDVDVGETAWFWCRWYLWPETGCVDVVAFMLREEAELTWEGPIRFCCDLALWLRLGHTASEFL